MAWDPIVETEMIPGNAFLHHMRQVWNCLKWLYGQIGTQAQAAVLNGSFEVDSNADGQPDNWTFNTYPGGSGVIDTANGADGVNAYKIVHPGGAGNGGGYLESDYIPCSQLVTLFLSFIHWATAAGMHNQVKVRFFDKGKVEVANSSVLIYSSTANPAIQTYFGFPFTPPANARFYKIDLIGGQTDTNVAGSAYFDAVQLGNPAGSYKSTSGMQIFSASGTFTVPAGVTTIFARVWGGGGGGGVNGGAGGTGGTSAIGSISALGGGGGSFSGGAGGVGNVLTGGAGAPGYSVAGIGDVANTATLPALGGVLMGATGTGGGGQGGSNTYGGGAGGYSEGLIAVTPGQTLTVTVGLGGIAPYGSPGNPGKVVIQW